MKFSPQLVEGIIRSRKGQFIMTADVDGEEQRCCCPCTGQVGDLDVIGRPYLLSEARDTDRKTKYTVEAISLIVRRIKINHGSRLIKIVLIGMWNIV